MSVNQEKKVQYLEAKGGTRADSMVKVQMPDGSIATIDSWGRVTWSDKQESEIKRLDLDEEYMADDDFSKAMQETADGDYVRYDDHESTLAQARAEERERCAAVAERFKYSSWSQDIADAIRALSDTDERTEK